jgi:hypothetical protein
MARCLRPVCHRPRKPEARRGKLLAAGALKKVPALEGGVKKLPPRPCALALEAIRAVPSKLNETTIDRCFTLTRDSLGIAPGRVRVKRRERRRARSSSVRRGFGAAEAHILARIVGSMAVAVFNPEVDGLAGETAAADHASRFRERSDLTGYRLFGSA